MSCAKSDEDKFLKDSIADNVLFDEPFGFNEIISALSNHNLELELSHNEGVEVIDDEMIDEISHVMPHIRAISEKPRTFIKSYDDKVHIDVAKRINHKAIAVLSRDSNDWYARTRLSVHPKKVVAEVSEETMDLYENRFVCMVIDVLSVILRDMRQSYGEQLRMAHEQASRYSDSVRYDTNFYASFQFCRKITNNGKLYEYQSDYEKSLENELNRIHGFTKMISLLKRSDFYKVLHKARKVKDPIQKTNILMYDSHYNHCYRFWKYLNEKHWMVRIKLQEEKIDSELLQNAYVLYVFLCLCASMHDMGFKEINGAKATYTDSGLKSFNLDVDSDHTSDKSDFLFYREWDESEFTCWVENGIIKMKHRSDFRDNLNSSRQIKRHFIHLDDKTKHFKEFWFYPEYIDFEEMSENKINVTSAGILDRLCNFQDSSNITRYSVLPVNLTRCFEDKSLSDEVLRRFFSLGDCFLSTEPHFNKWSSYRTGILMVTPSSLWDNFFRIEKTINQHLISKAMLREMEKCPVCGGTMYEYKDTQVCADCGNCYSHSCCNSCGSINWVKHKDDSFLEDKEEMAKYSEFSRYKQLSEIEKKMKESAMTGFDFLMVDNRYHLVTICPKCGKKLGE